MSTASHNDLFFPGAVTPSRQAQHQAANARHGASGINRRRRPKGRRAPHGKGIPAYGDQDRKRQAGPYLGGKTVCQQSRRGGRATDAGVTPGANVTRTISVPFSSRGRDTNADASASDACTKPRCSQKFWNVLFPVQIHAVRVRVKYLARPACAVPFPPSHID